LPEPVDPGEWIAGKLEHEPPAKIECGQSVNEQLIVLIGGLSNN
jgi:hypothetical protein